MSQFARYIGIDYSGAQTSCSRLNNLRVFAAKSDSAPVRVGPPKGKKLNWTRKEVAHWCLDQLSGAEPIIIGIDHGFSFPLSYMERYQIASWDHFLEDFHQYWPTDQDDSSVESLRKGNKRTGLHKEFRLTENWTSSAQSVFKLDGAGTVGKSTHCGIPWIRFLRRNANYSHPPHFWPFDGFEISPNKSAIVEVFPSIFRRRYPKRYKTSDEHDAMCVVQWLKNMDSRGLLNTYLNPPLTENEKQAARLEGWILGIN